MPARSIGPFHRLISNVKICARRHVQRAAQIRRGRLLGRNHRQRAEIFALPVLFLYADTLKKYSPPYPLDTKGCCSPQNNPKKSSSLNLPRFSGISNDLFVDCTSRFSHFS